MRVLNRLIGALLMVAALALLPLLFLGEMDIYNVGAVKPNISDISFAVIGLRSTK